MTKTNQSYNWRTGIKSKNREKRRSVEYKSGTSGNHLEVSRSYLRFETGDKFQCFKFHKDFSLFDFVRLLLKEGGSHLEDDELINIELLVASERGRQRLEKYDNPELYN